MTRKNLGRNVLFSAGLILLATFVSTLCLPVPAGAESAGIGWNESIAAKKGKAKTIADLAAYYDSSGCATCHKEAHAQWQNTSHSASLVGTGRTADVFWGFIQEGLMKWNYSGVKGTGDVKVEHLMACAKCHLPQLADADDDVAREIVAVLAERQGALERKDADTAGKATAKLRTLNISCLICHNRNAVMHKWTDGYPKAGEIYGSKDGAHPGPGYTVMKKSPIMGESILCGQCHGLGPNLDLANPTQCTTLYGSYIYAYRSQGGKESCQDCHMRKNKVGHETRALYDPKLIQSALDVKTVTHGFFWRDNRQYVPRVIVDVSILNKAGHAIPDSVSSNHRLVLSVTAKKADGTQVFSQDKIYMQVPQYLGRGGKMGRAAYEKTGVVEDSSLAPGETVHEKFDFTLEPEEETAGKRKKLFSELEVFVSIRQLNPDDAQNNTGHTLYETSRTVTIEER